MHALLVIETKTRLIANTPYDVLKLAANLQHHGWTVEIVDMRYELPQQALCPADVVYVFLETAGTWMCFDWDEPRFQRTVDLLLAHHENVILVGPQAGAVRELVGPLVRCITDLAFEHIIDPAYDERIEPDYDFIARTAPHYNGEHYADGEYSLQPTVSVYHAMACPMSCEFCFYGTKTGGKTIPWPQLATEITALVARGHEHFFFLDPNLLLDHEGERELRGLRAKHPGFTYYCQVSPNALTEARVRSLRESACRGMVIGIENADLIRFKGTLDGARAAVDRVLEAGMMPMLYFLVDGTNDVDAVWKTFADVPFRYSVLNDAFAAGGSLREIREGFSRRAGLRTNAGELITKLRRSPNYLDQIAGSTK